MAPGVSNGLLVAAVVGLLWAGGAYWRLRLRLRQIEFIDGYRWPKGLLQRLQKRRPDLSARDAELVAQGLRQFFRVYLSSGHQTLAMPSQLADDLWHEFILYTKAYEAFCRQAFGRFFHHTPAVVLGPVRNINTGLRRCWWWCCKDENIRPAEPSRLPLLFALDAKFAIADGFRYVPDCSGVRRTDGGAGGTHCAGDFADASVDGSTDGWGQNDSNSDGDNGGVGCSGGDGGCGGGGD